MTAPILYVDCSEVREGCLDQAKETMTRLADFVAANEPELLTYAVYFNPEGTRMTVVQLHADASTLDFHMQVAGPRFAAMAPFIKLLSIDVYGDVGNALTERLREKATALGTGVVRIHGLHAGFAFPRA